METLSMQMSEINSLSDEQKICVVQFLSIRRRFERQRVTQTIGCGMVIASSFLVGQIVDFPFEKWQNIIIIASLVLWLISEFLRFFMIRNCKTELAELGLPSGAAKGGKPEHEDTPFGKLYVWKGVQPQGAGTKRGDLYVMDFGGARAAYFQQ